jgi:glutaredoxin-like protein
MEKLLNNDISNQLKTLFNDLRDPIQIALFTREGDCETCAETKQLITEVSDLSEKIDLQLYDIDKNADRAKQYGIELVPSFVILDKDGIDRGVHFNGIPAGHEINSFISAILEMSGLESELPKEVMDRIAKIDKPVNIKVFVTLSCPHCPGAVQKAHKLAMLNPNITGEMIEAQTFYELSDKFNVSGVPKIIINDSLELLGNQPIESFLSSIESL